MKTTAIHCSSIGTVRGELIARHENETVAIRFAGSIIMHAREITIADMMAAAQQGMEDSVQ